MEVTCNGKTTILTRREYSVYTALLEKAGRVLSRPEIITLADIEVGEGSRCVDVTVGYIRRKLGKRVIKSVRGYGYSINTKLLNIKE